MPSTSFPLNYLYRPIYFRIFSNPLQLLLSYHSNRNILSMYYSYAGTIIRCPGNATQSLTQHPSSAMAAPPRYSRAHVDHCAFAAWYPRLRHASIKSEVIPLPPAFVSYLLADGVTLPETVEEVDDPVASAAAAIRAEIQRILTQFSGKAFVKTNWSAPRDASWMLGSLQCSTVDDVLLLLQSSDFVVHDLTQPYRGCAATLEGEDELTMEAVRTSPAREPTLVIKKWCNLFDSMLFRCFVVDHALVAVSQRHCSEFYDFLVEQQDFLCERIFDFFSTHLASADAFPDPDYIFDVYVDKKHRVFLVDINVFGDVTDPLLFSWDELEQLRAEGVDCRRQDEDDLPPQVVDFRIVESKQGIHANPLSGYRAPTDLVDHLAGGAGFEAFLEQVKRDNAAQDSDSDSDE